MKFISNKNIIHSMSKDNKPAEEILSGEMFQVETASPGIPDEVFVKDYSDKNYPKRVLSITGPIFIKGAEAGDVLKISVHKIELKEEGKMWMGQWMGILMDEVDKPYLKKVKVLDEKVYFSDNMVFETRPMIGTIGVAPAGEDVNCLYPGEYGGNMDTTLIRPGAVLYLPVQVEGALLALGDVHAAMGEGEVFGTGIEIGSIVTLEVEVIKNEHINHPLVEDNDLYAVLVSNKDVKKACKEATKEAISLVRNKLGLSFEEAYALVGQCADLRICQVVNEVSTVRFEINKKYIK